MWAYVTDASCFRVRGASYLLDGIKQPADPTAQFQLLNVSVHATQPPKPPPTCIGTFLRICVRVHEHRYIACSFGTTNAVHTLGLAARLFDAAACNRDAALQRLKVILHSYDASWFDAMFPQIPLRVANVCSIVSELHAPHAVDVHVDAYDVGLLRWPLHYAAFRAATTASFGLGFVLEGQTPAELPEAVLGAVRLDAFGVL